MIYGITGSSSSCFGQKNAEPHPVHMMIGSYTYPVRYVPFAQCIVFVALIFTVILFFPLLWFLAAVSLDAYGRRPHPTGTWDAVVVPGCAVFPGGRPSPPLRRRTLDAVEIWKQSGSNYLILSGGVGRNPPSEAEVAAELARGEGVPEDRLLLEAQSRNTWENALFSSKLDVGGVTAAGWSILVVSDGYHVWRCRRQFSRYFDSVQVAGSLPGRELRYRGALREVFSILKMLYYGWVARD